MKATKVALFVLALGFFAACGEDKKPDAPAAEPTTAIDTVTATTPDSAAAAPADSAHADSAAHAEAPAHH